ncbi:hypothetical protein OAA58_02700 [Polaribacter sp.]|nr:hypothetical protein [Polaribacter sp.]
MKKLFDFLQAPVVVLIVIYGCIIQGLFIPSKLQFYTFSDLHSEGYKYGNFISRSFVYVGFALSLFYFLML